MAKICIILATYNGEKYLSKMLESLVVQNRPADFIIAVDDGSKDSSVQILEKFKDRLPLQITVSPQNQGHRAAFSKALQLAEHQLADNDLIALADQDDIWLPNKLQILEDSLKDCEQDLVFGDAQVIDGDGRITHESWRAQALIQNKISMEQQIAGINNVTGCLCLFRASLLPKIMPIPEGVTVHDRWIAMMAQKNGGVKSIDQAVIQYRIHGENAVGGVTAPSMSKTLETQISWARTILNNSQRLGLNESEISFGNHLIKLTEKRLEKGLVLGELPWILRNRKKLFLQGSTLQTLKRVLFTAIGLPLARKLWGKS